MGKEEKRVNMPASRKSGILLHITSLPNEYGIGDLGREAYDFIDFLHASGQKLWQILPLGPTDFFGSPYAPYSAFAGNLHLISPDLLLKEELILESDLDSIQFDSPEAKYILIKQAFARFQKRSSADLQAEYERFCRSNQFWLDDFALFMALKHHFKRVSWIEWSEELAMRKESTLVHWREKLALETEQQIFGQYLFFRQWEKLKDYAHKKGISIIGDLPLFVAHDSADVWAKPELFLLDKRGLPEFVAGVPPDYFSRTGQLWGNPVYNWDAHYEERFDWWLKRIEVLLQLVDLVRVDHFRGLAAYWQIPYGEKTAINGRWMPGPGSDFFAAVKTELGTLPFIAEDLGFIDDAVIELRDKWKLPGMRVLQFAFEALKPNIHSPHAHTENCAVYTGTHDNDTTLGWYQKSNPKVKDYVCRYLNCDGTDIAWDLIRAALASPANLAITPLQDILALDSSARMNVPGTVAGNWRWRLSAHHLTEEIGLRLKDFTELYDR